MGNDRKWMLLIGLITILTVMSLVFCIAIILPISPVEPTPDPFCERYEGIILSDLIIENEDLPERWFLGKKGFGLDTDRSWDSAGSYYYTSEYQDQFPRLITQNIYRHQSIEKAERDYLHGLAYPSTSAGPPAEWNFHSIIADESELLCLDTFCNWVARYGCIVVDISWRTIPGYSTVDDMENIVRLVDKKAGELLRRQD